MNHPKIMKQKRRFIIMALAAAAGLLLGGGCATTDARYIDSKGTETVVTLNEINIQDWTRAAEEMVQSLLTSGVLERAAEQPAVLGISVITNDTTQQVDTDRLTKKIRVALNKSGKVMTTTTVGLGGRQEDPLAASTGDYQRYLGETEKKEKMPHFTLSGKILEDRVRRRDIRQTTYTFQLSLTEVGSGLAVWEEEREITKQGARPSVGW